MSPLSRTIFAALLAAVTLRVTQAASTTCEDTCEPKYLAAIKCNTMDCACYAYDDSDYVSCLRSQCGKGFSSVRDLQVQVCSYYKVVLSPDPPSGGDGGSQQTPTGSSSPKSTGTSGTGTGSGSGSGSSSVSGTNPGPNTNSGAQSSGGKDGLTTAELIGIIIGAVSAVATIIGVWVAIRTRKNKKERNNGKSAAGVSYQPIPPPAPAPPYYPPAPVQNVPLGGVWNTRPAQPSYQPPPAYQPYQSVYVWRK